MFDNLWQFRVWTFAKNLGYTGWSLFITGKWCFPGKAHPQYSQSVLFNYNMALFYPEKSIHTHHIQSNHIQSNHIKLYHIQSYIYILYRYDFIWWNMIFNHLMQSLNPCQCHLKIPRQLVWSGGGDHTPSWEHRKNILWEHALVDWSTWWDQAR